MDTNILTSAGISAGTVSIILLVYAILKSICGKKLICDCFKRNYEVGVNIRNMDSPPDQYTPAPEIKI